VGYFNERKQGHFLTVFSAVWLYVTALFLPVRRPDFWPSTTQMQQAHTAPPRPTTCQQRRVAEGLVGVFLACPCSVFQGPEQLRALPSLGRFWCV
jgi:hypothetical protein